MCVCACARVCVHASEFVSSLLLPSPCLEYRRCSVIFSVITLYLIYLKCGKSRAKHLPVFPFAAGLHKHETAVPVLISREEWQLLTVWSSSRHGAFLSEEAFVGNNARPWW